MVIDTKLLMKKRNNAFRNISFFKIIKRKKIYWPVENTLHKEKVGIRKSNKIQFIDFFKYYNISYQIIIKIPCYKATMHANAI